MGEKYSGEMIREMIKEALQGSLDPDSLKRKNINEIAEELAVYHQELEYQNHELRRVQGELELVNQHYKDLFEQAPVGYVMYRENGEIIQANELFYRMFNVADHLSGRRIESLLGAEDQDAFYLHLKKVIKIQGKESVYLQSSGEKKVYFRVESKMLAGDTKAIISAFVDVTIERLYEEKLKIAKKEAEEANLAKSNFLRNISHDLRTPIGAIRGFAQLIEMAEPGEDVTENIDVIKFSCDNMLKLVDDLIDLAKIEAGKMELDHEEFNIKQAIENSVKTVSESALLKNLQLTLSLPDHLPATVLGDTSRFQTVLLNILGNAVKFTEKGFIKVQVSIDDTPNHYCCLKFLVEDSGIGIAREYQNELFQPFKRLHKREKEFKGSGLGLMISQKVIEAMDGSIYVESELGKGTKVYFTVCFETVG